jgi:hypothetical protein
VPLLFRADGLHGPLQILAPLRACDRLLGGVVTGACLGEDTVFRVCRGCKALTCKLCLVDGRCGKCR